MPKNKLKSAVKSPHFYTIAGTAAMTMASDWFPKERVIIKGSEFNTNATQIYALVAFAIAIAIPALILLIKQIVKIPIIKGILTKFGLMPPGGN